MKNREGVGFETIFNVIFIMQLLILPAFLNLQLNLGIFKAVCLWEGEGKTFHL